MPILATKLHIPPSTSNVVYRSRLFQVLNRGLEHKLILVSAPAGFGKTTVITSWFETLDCAVAWLSLEEADNVPSRFLLYLIAALQSIEPGIGQYVMPILQSPQQPPLENILTLLLNDISLLEQNIILVLDDYHSIDMPEIDKALTFLLDHLPYHMTLIITTREDPQLPLAKYRARAELSELRAKDLRFTGDEMSIFLNQRMGLDLSSDAIAALENRTEGWIASLQMAAISLQGQDDKTRFVEAFTGSHRYIMDYLVEEVLQQQSAETRNFLLKTAILTRLNADLCDAVSETQGSQPVLEQLEKRNLFIAPLDNIRRWYRYHHLFADALQARLKRESPDDFMSSHQGAARWYEENAYPLEAIRHAFIATDYQLAARVLELIWSEMDLSYQSARWFKWAKQLPEDLILIRPVMCLAYAWAFINQGDFQAGEHYLQLAENQLDSELNDIVIHDVQQWEMLPAAIISARAYLAMATGQIDRTIYYAKESLALATDPAQTSHRQASALLGFASWAKGDLQEADKALERYLSGVNYSESGIIAYIGDLRIQLGQLHDAHRIYQESLKRLDDFPSPGVEELYRGLAEFYLETGNLDEAKQYLDMSKASGKQMAILTWQQRYFVTESRYYAISGEYDTALKLLDLAEAHYLQTAMPDIRPILAEKARIWLKQDRLDEVDYWVKQQGLATTDSLHYLKEYEHITLARLEIAAYQQSKNRESCEQIRDFLERLLKAAEAGSRLQTVIEIHILQAKLALVSGEVESALHLFEQALDCAEPQGYVYLFMVEGEDAKFLLQQSNHPYAPQLLAAFPNSSTRVKANPQAGLLDALSEREIDVLQKMAEGLTNPEIAERLYISKHTVKVHTRNIYSKLAVKNRTQAVTKARSLGIISE